MDEITGEELKQRMDRGETLHLVDVREPQEHSEFSIGGILLPLGQIRVLDVDSIEDLKGEEVICYCRSGNRSGLACQILDSLGFVRTRNLRGGMLYWQQHFGEGK
ncbi:MAG TPA: rhodanese-like domain-containing protein [Chitinophagaceae bacterium]|nr:rhodanese-like domain-containing protein [Chitinophagaceae bacterium]